MPPDHALDGNHPCHHAVYNSTHEIPNVHPMRRPLPSQCSEPPQTYVKGHTVRSPSRPMPPAHALDGKRPHQHAMYNPTHEIPGVHPMRCPLPSQRSESPCTHAKGHTVESPSRLMPPAHSLDGKHPHSHTAYNPIYEIPDAHLMRRPYPSKA